MKKTLLFISVLLIVWSASAQDKNDQAARSQKKKKFYIQLGLGGGVSTASSFDMLYKYSGDGANSKISVVPVGLGNGFNGSLAFGYWFNKYLAVEISVSEFLGLPTEGDSVINLIGASNATVKVRGSMLSVTPAIVISAGLEKINPYARFGLLVGALPYMITKYNEDNASTNPPLAKEIYNQYYGGVALGYTAAGGVSFNFTRLLSFFVELQFSHATWSPDHSEIMKYTVNGEDKLSGLTPWQKQADFVWERYTKGTIDMSQPRQELRKTYPFSTASINIGLKFKL